MNKVERLIHLHELGETKINKKYKIMMISEFIEKHRQDQYIRIDYYDTILDQVRKGTELMFRLHYYDKKKKIIREKKRFFGWNDYSEDEFIVLTHKDSESKLTDYGIMRIV